MRWLPYSCSQFANHFTELHVVEDGPQGNGVVLQQRDAGDGLIGDAFAVGGKARGAVEGEVVAAVEIAHDVVAPRFAVGAPAKIEEAVARCPKQAISIED